MLTAEQNDRLTRVGPGAPMGELMRRYWHPVATLSQMKDKYTKKVRVLGEDLILYKDLSGTYGLVDNFCPHRRMSMIYGVPEEHGLRCAYHGWLFGETGQCLEQPYEETEDPDGRFKDKVCIQAYPVQQMAGLLFAYLGPKPAPLPCRATGCSARRTHSIPSISSGCTSASPITYSITSAAPTSTLTTRSTPRLASTSSSTASSSAASPRATPRSTPPGSTATPL